MSGRCIAMWSGPRNISTAMMRSWEHRTDTQVVDEPFYAHYLAQTGIEHPMAADIIAAGETDWQRVVQQITTAPESGILYQKHICTHWLPHFTDDWLGALSHAFLIRDPLPVVLSYVKKRADADVRDLGYQQQRALFDTVCRITGDTPVVIDSARFLRNPEQQLRTLCTHLGLPFDAAMLNWPAGPRSSDGIWGAHWYDAVNRSTRFGPPPDAQPTDTRPTDSSPSGDTEAERLVEQLAEQCRADYAALARHAL